MFAGMAENISLETLRNTMDEAFSLYREFSKCYPEPAAHVAVWYGEKERNMKKAVLIWDQTMGKYRTYLEESPDYGGTKNGHAMSIYGSMLVFAMIDSLPD